MNDQPATPFAIPDHWTDEQAMAVVDLLDELRERIWASYNLRLLDAYRRDRQAPAHNQDKTAADQTPF